MVGVSIEGDGAAIKRAIVKAQRRRRVDLGEAVCLVAAAQNRDASLLDGLDREDCWPTLQQAWETIREAAYDGRIELHGNDSDDIPESGIPVIHPDRLVQTLRWIGGTNRISFHGREFDFATPGTWVDREYDERFRRYYHVYMEGEQLATLVGDIAEPEPAVSSPTVAQETACQKWLVELMRQSPNYRPKQKHDYYTEACTKFKASLWTKPARWFVRAWEAAMREAGVSAVWGRAGAPKKSKQA